MRKPALALVILGIVAPIHAAEGRIPIFEPIIIDGTPNCNPETSRCGDVSGRYILTNDLITHGSNPVIEIRGSGREQIELDLNGFTVAAAETATAVIAADDLLSLVIRNGSVVALADPSQATAKQGEPTCWEQIMDAGVIRVGVDAPVNRQVESVVIDHITVVGGAGHGIALNRIENFDITKNRILRSGFHGISVRGSTASGQIRARGSIVSNLIRNAGCRGMEVVRGASSIEILSNQVESSAQNGIHVGMDGLAIIANNSIEEVGARGIFVNQTNACRVSGNVIHGSGTNEATIGDGIFIASGSVGCLVLDNASNLNARNGIRIEGDNNHLAGNLLTGNQLCGLSFGVSAKGNAFSKTTARGNGNPAPASQCLQPPDFCDDGSNNTSFGDNLAPGSPPGGPC